MDRNRTETRYRPVRTRPGPILCRAQGARPDRVKEVEEIWTMFKTDVDEAKLTNAIISAHEVPHGMIVQTASAFNFVFRRSPDGRWQLGGDDDKQ